MRIKISYGFARARRHEAVNGGRGERAHENVLEGDGVAELSHSGTVRLRIYILLITIFKRTCCIN